MDKKKTKIFKIILLVLAILLYLLMIANLNSNVEAEIIEVNQVTTKPLVLQPIKTETIKPKITIHNEKVIGDSSAAIPDKPKVQKKKYKYNITETERELLLKLIYCEANTESIECQMAVALVVLNRTEFKGFPNTIKEVIYDKGQFTPIYDGSFNRATPTKQNEKALANVLQGKYTIPSDITFFWTTDVDVNTPGTWYNKMHRNNLYKQLDNTYFYSGK